MTKRWSQHQGSLHAAINELLSLDPESYSRRSDFGTEGQFERAPTIVTYLQELLSQKIDDRIHLVPDHRAATLVSAVTQVLQTLGEIKSFNPSDYGSNAGPQRSALQNALQTQSNNVFDNFVPIAPVMAFDKTHVVRLEEALSNVNLLVSEKIDPIVGELNDRLNASTTIIEEMRGQVGELGAARQAEHFGEEAERFRQSSVVWLAISGTIGLVFFVYALATIQLSFGYDYNRIDTALAAQLIFGKLLIAAGLAYAASASVKTYLSNRHNEAVNRHRQNALRSFRALVEANADPAQRDIVLGQAAQAIFAPQDTGFSRAAPTSPDVNPTVINALPRLVS